MIRLARARDAAAIATLWNHFIAETTVTFTTEPKTEADLRALIDERSAAFLVAEDAGTLLGFATYGAFRSGPGYAASAEHSVMLSAAGQGRGLGRTLLGALEQQAAQNGIHVLIAGVSGENHAAIAFHRRMGFVETARMPQVGRKFDRWLDLVCLQKIL